MQKRNKRSIQKTVRLPLDLHTELCKRGKVAPQLIKAAREYLYLIKLREGKTQEKHNE